MTDQPEDPGPLLYGKPRPKPPHYAAIFDEALAVGRTDVTDAVERALRKIPAATLMYPDLYAHKVTEALLGAGLVLAEGEDPKCEHGMGLTDLCQFASHIANEED